MEIHFDAPAINGLKSDFLMIKNKDEQHKKL